MRADVVVTGIGVVCPQDGLRSPPSVAAIDASGPPTSNAAQLDVEAPLGPRGCAHVSPVVAYLLAATRRALADAGDCLSSESQDRWGVAVGTNNAAFGLSDRMARGVTEDEAHDLGAARSPFSSIDLFTNRLPLRHGLESFGLTCTSPCVAGLEAVEIGSRAVALGKSSLLLAGAVEALDPAHRGEPAAMEAGAVALVVEPREAVLARSAAAYGSCRVRTFFLPPQLLESQEGRKRAGLAVKEALRALRRSSASCGLPAVHTVLDDSVVSATVHEALWESGIPQGSFEAPRRRGREGCLEPMLHVARLLAQGDRDRIVVTATAQGNGAFAQILHYRE